MVKPTDDPSEAQLARGERFREARESAGLSQRGLADAADVSPGWVYHLEQALIKEPGWDNVVACAAALKVRDVWLMTGEGPRDAGRPPEVA